MLKSAKTCVKIYFRSVASPFVLKRKGWDMCQVSSILIIFIPDLENWPLRSLFASSTSIKNGSDQGVCLRSRSHCDRTSVSLWLQHRLPGPFHPGLDKVVKLHTFSVSKGFLLTTLRKSLFSLAWISQNVVLIESCVSSVTAPGCSEKECTHPHPITKLFSPSGSRADSWPQQGRQRGSDQCIPGHSGVQLSRGWEKSVSALRDFWPCSNALV